MHRQYFSVPLLLLVLLFSVPFPANADFWADLPDEVLLNNLMSEMSDEELLAQLMLFGYMGGTPSDGIMRWIEEYGIGGIKVFGWNVKDLPTLADSIAGMQEAAMKTRLRIPLFTVTDQEGGWVRHIRGRTSETPGNMAIGASSRPDDAYRTGVYIGRELRALGINMNFAPTVDVYSNPRADVIGPRAFSDDPLETAVLSTAWFKGMDSVGVICTAKHFPGHGDADKDSHGALPVIRIDYDTLWNRDLLPYRYLVKEDLPAVMSGHLAFPLITGHEMPASLSPFFLTEILRNRMGFSGIVVTDDLMMNGVQNQPMNTPQICKAAIEAGNDVLLVSRTEEVQQRVWDYLSEEMKVNREFRSKVIEAAERILRTKIKYLANDDRVPLFPDGSSIYREVPDTEGSSFFLDQAVRSATVVRGNPVVGSGGGRVLLAGQLQRFFNEGKKVFPHADVFDFDYSPSGSSSPSVRREFRRLASGYDTVIFCLANRNSAEVLDTIKDSSINLHVLSVLTPVYLSDMPWVENALAVYGTGSESFAAGFGVISGRIEASGKMPLELDNFRTNGR